ncbi:MAG: 2,3-bisphosphoglycerate-independent phosphoglycerate mutase [Spirochaetes bacterium]|nr:2,3-bisphosphoglycerate-independent phosphoglycerate mutase [Spirochaetota bacterium]
MGQLFSSAINKETFVPNRVALIILDGYALSKRTDGNAIAMAKHPFLDSLFKDYPNSSLVSCGEAVGLPEGQMGNSEVGHLNIGAGRIVYQSLTRVSKSIRDGDFFTNPVLRDGIEHCARNRTALHLIGLVSDGGVHSHLDHLYAFLAFAKKNNVRDVFLHADLDGRDVPPRSAIPYLKAVEEKMREIGIGKIATVSGRYYGMDRDKRWDRVQKAYDAYVLGQGVTADSAVAAVEKSYAADTDDEFCLPTVITKDGKPVGTINDNDTVICFNFRPDRVREITDAIANDGFNGFPRAKKVSVKYICLTQYDEKFDLPVAFHPEHLTNILAEVLAANKITELRIAETEKYAHVTFFFNGQIEKEFPGEERVLIPSPKVATYDMKPEMSAPEVADKTVELINAEKYDVIIMNFANCDMVGHTGVIPAAVKAVEAVDAAVKKVVEAFLAKGGEVLITADHGNADEMLMEDGSVSTQHSLNPVPIIAVSKKKYAIRSGGGLADIAPTMLKLLGVAKPKEMTGESLLQ